MRLRGMGNGGRLDAHDQRRQGDGRIGPRVAIITSNFWPEQTGISQTVSEFAEFLVGRDVEVRVATAMPFYPQWKIWDGYRGALWRKENRSGMTIFRSWHRVSPRPSTVGRLLHETSLALFALPSMIRALGGARRAYVVSPPLTYAVVGLAVAAMMQVPRVLIVKDVMPDTAVELGMLRNRALIAFSRHLARWAYVLAQEIHTLGEGMLRRIARVAGPSKKIRIVPDTVDTKELGPIPRERNEFRKRFVGPQTFAVLHAGNMGRKQDLGLVLRAAARLRHDPTVRFYVFGDGAEKASFLEQRGAMRLENISHYPLQPRSMLAHMLSGADVVLVSQLAEVVDIVVPSKLLTAMVSGAMIVAACSADSETACLVRESGGGIVIGAGDDAALVHAIDQVRRGGIDVRACREKARRFAESRFDRNTVYSGVVRSLLEERDSAGFKGGSGATSTVSLGSAIEKGVER